MESENSISSLLTSESKFQRPVAPVVKIDSDGDWDDGCICYVEN